MWKPIILSYIPTGEKTFHPVIDGGSDERAQNTSEKQTITGGTDY